MGKNSFGVLLLSLLLILFFHDVLFLGKTLSVSSLLPGTTPQGPFGFSGHRPETPFSFDIAGNALVNEPNPYIIRRLLDEKTLPAWNPFEGLGIPLIGNLNTEVFNPLKVFLNLFPSPFSQDIFFLARLLVMGLFTYLFLKEMRLSPGSSFLGSAFFMLSGYSAWWINLHPLSTVMYLPAVFYFYERWSNRKGFMGPFFMSLSLSLAFVSGKIPDVIMGVCLLFLYAVWKGIITTPTPPPHHLETGRSKGGGMISVGGRGSYDIFVSILKEGGKVILVSLSGALMAAAALVPFLELYSEASPLAKAIRTGAAGHTLPLLTSVSLVQPLFLGWKNYFYGSWFKWTPDAVLPHAGIMIAVLSIYAIFHGGILKKTFPWFIFSFFIFLTVYGLIPFHAVSHIPVFRSIEFLKYNAMFYFALAVMSAHAFDDLSSAAGSGKKLNLSIATVSLLILLYFFFLHRVSPAGINGYLLAVLSFSISGMIILGAVFHFSAGKRLFGILVLAFLISELFIYMPKDHPDRADPYKEPPYLNIVKGGIPYRFIGDGSLIPPLVSSAVGLYDIRGISVLLPRDYYLFFEHLVSFSVPQTNNPSPLFSATSPSIDLLGVKYILSRQKLEYQELEHEVNAHIGSLRWIRFFDAMISHTVRGGASYGYFDPGGEKRFSFFFPRRFAFETKLRVSEPFLFVGFAARDMSDNSTAKLKIVVGNDVTEVSIKSGDGWKDRWLDISPYMGKVIVIALEGDGSGDGRIALGNFGLSPGYEKERLDRESLLALHKREVDFLRYRGEYEGVHIYENINVMDRAFVLHKIESTDHLDDVIKDLREGINFREVGLVSPSGIRYNPPLSSLKLGGDERGVNEEGLSQPSEQSDKIVIRKYASDEIEIEARSQGGLLVLSDFYYPGWKVKVNGKEERVIKAFGLLRGVLIGPGRSEVIFSYRPLSFYLGIVISLTTFIIWATVLYLQRRRSRPL